MSRPSTDEILAAAERGELRRLSEDLIDQGFNEARVLGLYGWSHIAAMSWAEHDLPTTLPPAARLIALFTTARGLPHHDAAEVLDHWLEPLLDAGLLEDVAGAVRSRIRLVPVGRSLLPCDQTELGDGAVATPDDSTYHLLGCLPDSTGSWLDVGTGNGALIFARNRETALGTDIDDRALAFARLGARINGRESDRFEHADCCDISGRFDLVTFNAPLPTRFGEQASGYRRSSDDRLLDRFWTQVGERVADGGQVLVHTWLDGSQLPSGLAGGEITIARYTGDGQPHGFGVVRWRPDAAPAVRRRQCPLSRHHPHLTARDLD